MIKRLTIAQRESIQTLCQKMKLKGWKYCHWARGINTDIILKLKHPNGTIHYLRVSESGGLSWETPTWLRKFF